MNRNKFNEQQKIEQLKNDKRVYNKVYIPKLTRFIV
jgi:hypothetical protein